MVETNILLIRELSSKFDNVQRVSSTSDFKLLSILDKNNILKISSIKLSSNILELTNLISFTWQEDSYIPNNYKLLVIDVNNHICLYEIKIINLPGNGCHLEEECVSRWNLIKSLQQFHQLAKQLDDSSSFEILKFEAKEAVFLFEKKVVVSFFLFPGNDPQIMSISDLSDGQNTYKKVLLMKNMLFALDEHEYKLSIYSFLNNSKVHDIDFSECSFKPKSDPIRNFSVNLKMDRIIFVTESQKLYAVTLDLSTHIGGNSSQTIPSSMVTAFTKQFPSVRRIDDSLRRFSVSSESVQPVILTCETSSLILKELFVLESKLFFLYQGETHSLVGIHALDIDEPTAYKIIQHQVFFLHTKPEEITFPLLLFFEDKISLFVYNIAQDKLVNELMIYPSSGAVEVLALLNNWNSIQMDVEVLRLGLRNRKIYTVEFYLKTLFEGFSQQWHAPSSIKWLEKIKNECSNWENIIHLVLENIRQNLSDTSTCQYAEQLLQILIMMVIQILDVIQGKMTDSYFLSPEKTTILSNFMNKLIQLRTLLRIQELPTPEPLDAKKLVQKSQFCSKVLECWKKWEDEAPKDIIQESLLDGTVPLAQSYFYCCCKNANCPSYEQFETVAHDLVLYFLRQGLMPQALSILTNMGKDINMKLLQIFKSTAEKDVRSLMIHELEERNLFNNFDKNLFDFASLLEKLYPCSSFEHARLLLEEKSADDPMNCASPASEKHLTVGDFLAFNQDNSESGEYCRIILDWLDLWDNDTRSRILTPHFLKNSSILDFFNKKGVNLEISPSSVWNYLLENGHVSHLTKWIDDWLQSDKVSIFKDWPITEAMIQSIPERAPSSISDQLLNKLARSGIFCEEELDNITSFLVRIGRSQLDVNAIDIYRTDKNSVLFSDMMHKLVHYCIKNDLVHLLFSLLFQNFKEFSLWPECSSCDVPLMTLTKSFYLWTENETDSHFAYDAMAKAAQYLYNLQSSTAVELLENLPLPLCLSVFLFKPQPLLETVQEALENTELSEMTMKQKFSPYPLLSNYLLKGSPAQQGLDVTVYELLKGSTMFDTSQLFGWQTSNKIKSEESMSELPHFSLKSLSEQYGLKKELNYLYYLMQGRPNYAYLKFIQQEVVLETGLSIPRIKSSCSDVMDYCLANYRSAEISMACVLFIELVGQDSLPLRACLMAANMLHDSRTPENEKEQDKSLQEIWKMFKLAHLSKDSAAELTSELEKITVKVWDPYSTDMNSLVSDICLWMPVMTISYLFEVEAGNKYLHECARQNKWLKFLVFAQIFQVPKEQVLKAASKFSNSCIYYHIFHALQKKQQEVVVSLPNKTPNDMRKSLYSRAYEKKEKPNLGLKKPTDSEDDRASISSEDTSSSDTDMRSFIMKDLFSQLLVAHNSEVPWETLLHTSLEIQNPVLAILAVSYPDAPLQNCFFIWLYTTLCHDEHTKKQIEPSCCPNRIKDISTDDIEQLVMLCIQNRKILIMWQAVQFFLPTTPLLPLMEFLKDFLIYKKFGSSIECFQNKLWDYPKNSSDQTSVLHSALWIENISVSVLKISVISCSTSYERLILLKHFSHTRLEKSFSKEVPVPPFMKVYNMLQYTSEINQDIDVRKLFFPEHDTNYQNECWAAVNKLLKLHLFQDAEMFAAVAKLPMENLFLLQIKQTVEEARQDANWNQLSYRIEFWKPILDKLSSVISIHAAVDFLENQCEYSDLFGEKYYLLKFKIHLLSSSNYDSNGKEHDLAELQKKMWLWCIKAEVNNQITPELLDVKPEYDFSTQSILEKKIKTFLVIEDDAEKESLGRIIRFFLINKDPKKAFDLAYTFGYNSQDLDIVQTCLKLAKEELGIKAVDISIPDCNIEVPSSRFIRSLALWLSSNSSGIISAKTDVMKCIELLGRKSEAAISICHQILVHYVVATVLKKRFDDIASEKNTLSILKQILSKKLSDEYILAKCFIVVRDLPDRDVAIFLSKEIQHSLEVLCLFDLVLIPEEQLAFSEELIYDPQRTNESFQLIVKLCQDPSLLGNILMDKYTKETSELSSKSSDKNFSSAVELCICAHECFTAACNMDGISRILHSSQHLVNLLEEAKKFFIMVRLLTGLGRYSEMVWVFDVLKSHDKLSLLFVDKMENVHQSAEERKKSSRISEAPNLKLALLDYLKRLPPSEGDTYFYKLANKFEMHREKAEILEMSVQKQLSLLCKKNLDIDMREDLEKAMNCLAEAAESYCEADCLHQAQNCTRLAQLVALQIYFQPSGIWIIGLDKSSVARFITDHDNFPQSFIVAEQYSNHQLWNQAVLNNVVCRGDREYLRDYQAQFGLSTSLITDIVKRYLKLQPKSESMIKNIKYLLGFCRNVKVKYSLALEAGFQDMASELLMGEGASYLQDLIANNLLK